MIGDSPVAGEFEPLLVALRLRAGEQVRAPQEIRQVALGVMHRIEERRDGG